MCGSTARRTSGPSTASRGAARTHRRRWPAGLPPGGPIARIVANDYLVSFETNRYSVPFVLIGQTVEVHRQDEHSTSLSAANVVVTHDGCRASTNSASCRSTAPAPSPARRASGLQRRRYATRGGVDTPEVEVRDLTIYEQFARAGRPGGGAMTAAQLERLHEHLQRLRLFKSRERLEAVLQEATSKELTYADFLDQVLTEEVASKTAKHVTMRTSLARFPFVKGLEAFDFSYQPSLDKKQIQTLSELPLHRARRESRHPRAAGRRQDPPGRRPRPQGHRARLPGALHHGGGDDRHA